jgi:Ni/Fe-hydrogenase subunit HybB-like protein
MSVPMFINYIILHGLGLIIMKLIIHTQQDSNHHGNNNSLIANHTNSIWQYITVYHSKMVLRPKHVVAVTKRKDCCIDKLNSVA